MLRSNVLRAAMAGLGLALVSYAAIVVYYKANETRLVFLPINEALTPADSFGLDYEEVRFPAEDGVEVTALVVRAPQRSVGRWILFFHGQETTAARPINAARYKLFNAAGAHVFAVEYRGFGTSTVRPSEEGVYRDGVAAFDYLTQQMSARPSRIVVYGHSLGSAVAVEVVRRVDAAGLVVEGGLASVARAGKEAYPFLPVQWLVTHRFDSLEKVGSIDEPKLFVHGRQDDILPATSHGIALFEAARPPKTLLLLEGGHAWAPLQDPERYRDGMIEFMRAVAAPQ